MEAFREFRVVLCAFHDFLLRLIEIYQSTLRFCVICFIVCFSLTCFDIVMITCTVLRFNVF